MEMMHPHRKMVAHEQRMAESLGIFLACQSHAPIARQQTLYIAGLGCLERQCLSVEKKRPETGRVGAACLKPVMNAALTLAVSLTEFAVKENDPLFNIASKIATQSGALAGLGTG